MRTAEQLGLDKMFEDVFDIVASDLVPKPNPQAYERFFEKHGVDPARSAIFEDIERNLVVPHVASLSFLSHFAGASEQWSVRALPERHVAMQMLTNDAVDKRRALAALPPLIKGYLRCGAKVGDGAVIDHQFGTTDVFIIM